MENLTQLHSCIHSISRLLPFGVSCVSLAVNVAASAGVLGLAVKELVGAAAHLSVELLVIVVTVVVLIFLAEEVILLVYEVLVVDGIIVVVGGLETSARGRVASAA